MISIFDIEYRNLHDASNVRRRQVANLANGLRRPILVGVAVGASIVAGAARARLSAIFAGLSRNLMLPADRGAPRRQNHA
jgi:hypothetical protein